MSAQQARIYALLDDAADQFEDTGAVDTFVQAQLDAEGYPLCQLDRDLPYLLSKREAA